MTWYRESIGLTDDFGDLPDAVMLDRGHGWAVAGDGRVLAYRPVTSVVERLAVQPKGFVLRQNYPNPFNPVTSIEYEVAEQSTVMVDVVDVNGRVVKVLVNAVQSPGVYRIQFEASGLANGVYYYQLKTEHSQQTKQMILLK
jgi:hypothetical protein